MQLERRHRIVRGAYALMENGEYEHIQMRDVAEESGVALATLYRYFASKEHLFAAVLVEWSGSLENRVERRPLKGNDVAAQLDDLMGRVLTAFERLPQFFRLMSVIETTPDEHARAMFDEFNGRSRSTFAVPLRPLDPDDGQDVLDVISAVLGAVLRSWAHGSITMGEVRGRMTRAIRVIFSPPPVPQIHRL